ncbi:Taurine catabolism dioxygenase TauD/TfdA [Penicillium macrosclerotiorum]|uniref:Taurine catabolism dioxygenase TauD/TfdA n=1 Tax=Penicillium macrosclerotiorum TaxID=303699 RepID=UPI0025472E35|nr:Taurine catabolism dioxygenase TauD/TfdA [Penicillium macrosclerotiorum]KAJ5690317.1 Taurine catabolism dioxygenase TauD/TfdA [Penicillium macrosclerotiorum]
MAPSLTETHAPVVPILDDKIILKGLERRPLNPSGALDAFESFDVTPVIGREFPNANLKDFLRAPNSDDLIRDLAITISQRGVVFFRKQDGLNDDLQKELIQRLGELSGKPSTSGLHIHPIVNSGREEGVADDEISVISSNQRKKLYAHRNQQRQTARHEWHSDITFEPIPSDYTALRLTELPKTGGANSLTPFPKDTLWASGYEVYDRLSEPYQKFLDGLTATYAQPRFNEVAANNNFKVHPGPRGAPENVGEELLAEHPVVRTNPVTGWKSIFAVGTHVQKVNGVTEEESAHLLQWFVKLIQENHDLQVRLRWQNPNDIAIWDNRSVYHAATWDYEEVGPRTGHRVVGLGERPYFDPKSISRRQALAESEEVSR